MHTLLFSPNKKLRALILCFFVFGQLHAQQLPILGQFNELQGVLNPAALSTNYLYSGYTLNMGLNYHTQWAGMPNAPKTSTLQVDYIHPRKSVSLITGGHLIKDQVSRVGTTGLYAKIGGVISKAPQDYGVSMAIHGGLVQYAVDTRNPQLIDEDDVLIFDKNKQLQPDIGFGVSFYTRLGKNDNLIFGGLSAPQILGTNLAYRNDDNNFDLKRARHYYAQAGYLINLDKDFTFLEFTTWIKHIKGAPLNTDISLKYQITEMLFFGTGINSAGVFNGNVGIELFNKFSGDNIIRINYGFGAPFFGKSPQFGTSHEIGIYIGFGQ